MEEYLKEAKKVEKNDNYLIEAYDHELSGLRAEREAVEEEYRDKMSSALRAEREAVEEEYREKI